MQKTYIVEVSCGTFGDMQIQVVFLSFFVLKKYVSTFVYKCTLIFSNIQVLRLLR